MPPRKYQQKQREASAAETRRRIVEATFALHSEQGIAATSMKQIAARAEVSVGTVYHHFPTYDDAVRACGAHTEATVPPPDAAMFAGLSSLDARIARVVEEVFLWFERLPVFERVRCDQDLVPALRPFVEAEERHRTALVREALQPVAPDEREVRTASALLDFAVYRSLRRAGLTAGEAAGEIAGVLLGWLGRARAAASPPDDRPTHPTQPKETQRGNQDR